MKNKTSMHTYAMVGASETIRKTKTKLRKIETILMDREIFPMLGPNIRVELNEVASKFARDIHEAERFISAHGDEQVIAK